MEDEQQPEIKFIPLNLLIIKLKSIGINDIWKFNFPSTPDFQNYEQSIKELKIIKCLDQFENLNTLGKALCSFSMDPVISRILLYAD